MVVDISIGKSSYKINCADGEQENILRFAANLNQRVNELSLQSGGNQDEKNLLVLIGLMMEEEIEKLESELPQEEFGGTSVDEEDIYDAVSENMENVADYIEKLIKKIRNY